MDIEKIICTYCNDATENKKENIRSWFSRVNAMRQTPTLEESLKSKDFLLKCFATSKTSTLSRSQYQRIKEILLYIFDYFQIDKSIIPSREEVVEASQMFGFFSDLNSVLTFIDTAGFRCIAGYRPDTGLTRIKSIAILLWLGFSLDEIINMLRSDIKISNSIISISKNEKKIVLSEDLFKILSLQAESTGVMTFPNGRFFHYKKQTNYLIKNRDGSPLTADHLVHLFKYFNNHSNSHSVLSIKGLRISGLFEKIYNDASDLELSKKIQKYFGCDVISSYGYKKLYEQWMKKFS